MLNSFQSASIWEKKDIYILVAILKFNHSIKGFWYLQKKYILPLRNIEELKEFKPVAQQRLKKFRRDTN